MKIPYKFSEKLGKCVKNYENGKLSELAEKQLFSYFTQEAERILKIQKEINSNYKGVSKIEGVKSV